MKKNILSKAELHRQAETKLSGGMRKKTTTPTTKVNILRLVHQSQVNQVELEMRNKELTQARVEVEKAYRQYTDLYDFAPVGYFTLTRNGIIHQVNLAGANLLGLEHNEATRVRLAAFVSIDFQPVFRVFFEKLLSGEGKEACELMFEKKGNSLLWARLEATCFEGGDVSRAMLMDITERKQMEQALRDSENRFRTTLQEVPNIAVQGYIMDGTTQYWNSASERLYGYSAQEAIGQNLLDLIIPPEMRSGVRQAIQQMAETGHPIPAAELSLMRKDGSRVNVYSSHTVFSIPGRAPELFCLDVDLTERKRAEAILQTRLRLSQFADSHSLNELLQSTLDEVEGLTGSQVGFIHFLEADQKTLRLQMWSNNTLKNMSSAKGKIMLYSVDQAGAWADYVSTRTPLIHNDLLNLDHRKQLPQGHTPILRELIVPILRNDLIVMIIGVGNKPTDYDDNDIEIVSQVANSAWDIVQRKQTEELLKESEWRNRIVSELTADYIFVVDVDPGGILKLRWVSDNMFRMTGRTIEEVATSDLWRNIIHPDDRERFFDFINQILSTAKAGELECRTFYKQGGERWINIYARPQVGEENNVTVIVGAVQDISERKQAEQALRMSEEKYRTVADFTYDWETWRGTDGAYLYVSPSCKRITEHTAEEFLADPYLIVKIAHPDDQSKVKEHWEAFATESKRRLLHLDFRIIVPDGKIRWVSQFSTSVYGENGQWLGRRESYRDITARVQAEQALETVNLALKTALVREQQLAHTDALTGINNRRHLYELAEREFEIALRYQRPLAVIMFDIDHFKEVNDTFGHATGDEILQHVTQVACKELRSADVIGRYGGEEFVILLPMTNAQQAYPLAERIRMGVEAMYVSTEKGDATVTLSIGIVEMNRDVQNGSVDNLIRSADKVMYAAKRAGRNRTEIGD
jgi:diguanylate cyclase (GGDEF)-like protein/PAS domain S-box-containing protein